MLLFPFAERIVPPVTDHCQLTGTEHVAEYVSVACSHRVNVPVMFGFGWELRMTDTLTVESQPKLFVSFTDTVPVPGEFHCTVMLLLFEAPTMVPPVTVHARELP